MEVRPGYKQSEVGVIPEEWNVRRISDVFNITAGGDFDSSCSSLIQDERYPFPIYSNSLSLRGLYGYSCYADHMAGSITVTARGSVGTSNYRDHKFTAIGRVLVLVSYETCDGQFFSEFINERISFAIESTGVPQLTAPQISGYKIPVPLLTEQRAIARALSDVDALLAKLDQLIAKKRDLKQATMQQLLTGQSRLPGFGGEWEVKRLGDLFVFSGGHTASRAQLSDSGYCYLHYGDIHLSTKTFIDLKAEFQDIPKLQVRLSDVNTASLLKDGDIVFVDASEDDEGTSKHIVVVNPDDLPYISGLHTIVAKSKGNKIDNLFKRYCFQTRNIKEQFRFFAVGTKVSGISKTSVAKIELNFPPSLAEQTAIATVLSDMDAELAALEARRDKTRALKQGMMQELLTGKIRLLAN